MRRLPHQGRWLRVCWGMGPAVRRDQSGIHSRPKLCCCKERACISGIGVHPDLAVRPETCHARPVTTYPSYLHQLVVSAANTRQRRRLPGMSASARHRSVLSVHSALPWQTLDEELERAAEVQRALRPPCFHAGPRFELAAAIRPCREVCGDFFDYADTNGDLRVVVGDVCGKGVAAGLQAGVVQGILANEADEGGGPAIALRHLNRTLCRRPVPDSYVTLFYAVVTSDHRLTYSNAGHCRPLLVTGDNVKELAAGGPPAGLFVDAQYEEEPVPIERGDVLLIVSDGITDAAGKTMRRREVSGGGRLIELLRANHDASAKGVLDRLLADVTAFTNGGPPQDDMTAVVVRCRA
jgi:serine phosphatase RsbU (regulator of sigma subunit)